MIKELDKRRPQVLIDVTLVEIFKNEDFQYDLEVVTTVPDLIAGDLIAPISLFGTPVSATQGYKSTGDTFTAFYADNHIQSLLTLMQTKEYGRVLSQPKLLVNDGEAGTINQEKTIYIARSTSSRNTNNTGDASIVSSSTQFDDFPSGITMTITPNIGEGDLLRLKIEIQRSQQDSPAKVEKDQPPPDKKQQDLSTIVTVPDKSTIILGGINELSQSKDTGKIPILGDIPIVGILFQNQTKFDKQAHLYVFVKAYILRPEEGHAGLPELTERSDEYRREFEIEEKKFQDHNWGSIKKTDPMLPMNILKDDK
jgi:MSHA biogenesis protein MshL